MPLRNIPSVFAENLERHGRLLIAGPTAAGKSALALRLAQAIGGEIISVDSMQVYRGMDIGTAKPSKAEQALAPHHLIDILDLSQQFDVALFLKLAASAEMEIKHRGRIPIYCGGTGFYYKALLQGIGDAPPADAAIRAELERSAPEVLLAELERADRETFRVIDRLNLRRVIRALEVIRVTGKPYSSFRTDWKASPSQESIFVLKRSPEEQNRRINDRVDQMFLDGLVEETKRLMVTGLEQNPVALQSLGYRQVVDYLQGRSKLQETVELVKLRTRQFAKRQMTWIRGQLPHIFLNPADVTQDRGKP